jgi:hypothetical protein
MSGFHKENSITEIQIDKNDELTPMEALDKVKITYASNFEKILNDDTNEYYYKLPIADYYLVYDSETKDGTGYLYHLYEFVVDEEDTGVGHTVTYGWYTVNKITGEITDQTQ